MPPTDYATNCTNDFYTTQIMQPGGDQLGSCAEYATKTRTGDKMNGTLKPSTQGQDTDRNSRPQTAGAGQCRLGGRSRSWRSGGARARG